MEKSIAKFGAVTPVGLDLAKTTFQVHAVDANGEVVAARFRAGGSSPSSPSCLRA